MAGCSLDRVSWDEAATKQLLTADWCWRCLLKCAKRQDDRERPANAQCNYSLNPYVLPNTKILSNNRS